MLNAEEQVAKRPKCFFLFFFLTYKLTDRIKVGNLFVLLDFVSFFHAKYTFMFSCGDYSPGCTGAQLNDR